jgi:hypothetical protein
MPDRPSATRDSFQFNDPENAYEQARLIITSACNKRPKYFSLRGLGLTRVPREIEQLTTLSHLSLKDNKLTALPPEIAKLTGLKWLNVSQNQLASLSDDLCQLPLLLHVELQGNPLSDPYPRLIEPGHPQATRNVLSYLRGELDLTTLLDLLPAKKNRVAQIALGNAGSEFEKSLQQRPAAFRFGIRNGKIDALPEDADVLDHHVARDLHSALLTKTRSLQERLAKTNADQRMRRSVERLLGALGSSLQDVRPGLLLSHSRSVEADLKSFELEMAPTSIAMMDDMLMSLRDLMAIYPIIRRIEAEQVALSIQGDATILDTIKAETKAIKAEASACRVVTQAAVEALRQHDAAIEEARDLVVRAGLTADQLLIVRNFLSEAARTARSTAEHLGPEQWIAVKANLLDGLGMTARLLPFGLFVLLLSNLAGPVAGLAIAVAGFKPIANAIRKLLEQSGPPDDKGSKSGSKRKSSASKAKVGRR